MRLPGPSRRRATCGPGRGHPQRHRDLAKGGRDRARGAGAVRARLGAAAMLPEMEAAFADWRPQLALRETCEYAAAVVATRRGVPHAQVAISRSENEAGALLTAAPVLEDYERGVVERITRSPYLTCFPASVDPDSFPDTRRFSEPRRPEVARLPSFWAGETLPLAYLSFGSVTGSLAMAGEVYRLALEAVKDLPMRVLLTVGNRIDVTELGPVPENVHVERWVPQEQVFPEASLVICHGGSGTTFGALAAGLPLVIVPLFADQSSNGHRVADAGAGVVVAAGDEKQSSRPFGHLDAARVAAAIKTVLNDPGYGRAAARIAASWPPCLPWERFWRLSARNWHRSHHNSRTTYRIAINHRRQPGGPPCHCTLTRPIPTTRN